MTTDRHEQTGRPSVAEIAALTARLRHLRSPEQTTDQHAHADEQGTSGFRWETDAADPDRIARTPEAIGHRWDRDAADYGPDVADEMFAAENPELRTEDHGRDNAAEDALGDEERRFWAACPTIPPELLNGMEERRTCPAEADDPAVLAGRLADLREQVAARDRAAASDRDCLVYQDPCAGQADTDDTGRGC